MLCVYVYRMVGLPLSPPKHVWEAAGHNCPVPSLLTPLLLRAATIQLAIAPHYSCPLLLAPRRFAMLLFTHHVMVDHLPVAVPMP